MMMRPLKDRPELTRLIALSRAAVEATTPTEREAMYAAQRRSWVRGELAMGSDADEARYRAASDAERKAIAAELSARADRLVPRGTD